MNLIQKALIAIGAIVIGLGGYLAWDNWLKPNLNDTPEAIVNDYRDLLDSAEALQVTAGANCQDKAGINKQIKSLEDRLAQLHERRKDWLDNVPKLPDVEPELIENSDTFNIPGSEVPELSSDAPPLPDIDLDNIEIVESPGRPGSEVPELSSDVPPLPDIDFDNIEIVESLGRPGSEIPELSSDVPPLPDINIEVIDESDEYIPEMPEINTGRPGSEIPELSSDVPPLPDINIEVIDESDEYIFQMDDYEQKIQALLQELKDLCKEDPNVTSDKCSDACQRYKDCAAYTEDVTEADMNDAYTTCMEECPAWPKEIIKCINAIKIKNPNDCVNFVQCRLGQFYEDTYLP